MNRYIVLILFICFFVITFCYTYFVSYLNFDEIWNYGFSYNIACGLVPYRDFNMLQNPLFFFVGSLFIRIFGNYLWSVHIFSAIIISVMMILIYGKIGRKVFILYPLVLVYSVYSYNILCLFFGILILICLDNDSRYNDYIISLLVSLLFLSKQNIGICMFIPMIFYSRDRIKSLIIFLIPNMLLVIYLLINNSLYDYVNYTVLGMFDFGKSNGIYHFIVFYVLLVGYLLYRLIKSGFKDKYIFYILAFQVVGIPIIDDYHFMIGFILLLYYLLFIKEFNMMYFKYFVIISLSYFFICIFNSSIKLVDYDLYNINLFNSKSSFLYGRCIDKKAQKMLNDLSSYVIDMRLEYDNVYLFSNMAYLIKLYLGENPSKYDLILNGNMGYKGSSKIINELDNVCLDNSCLFIIQPGLQINYEIVEYVNDNYSKIDEIKDILSNNRNGNSNYIVYSNRGGL